MECIGTIGMGYPGTLLRRRQRGILMHSYDNRSQIRALVIGGWAGLARLGASGSVPANHKKIAQGSARVVGRAQAADRDSRANNSATARDSAQWGQPAGGRASVGWPRAAGCPSPAASLSAAARLSAASLSVASSPAASNVRPAQPR